MVPMPDAIDIQLGLLDAWFRSFGSALVAYSGGVDSALVAATAHRALGERALCCIGVSPSLPAREREAALAQAAKIGIACRALATHEHLDPRYAANPENRCFFCKDALFSLLRRVAQEEGWAVLVDGSNASDRSDHRPGRAAAEEHSVRSPLAELNIPKSQVRAMAHRLGLDAWDKPAMACLASRVPHGSPVTPELLHRIERAEDALAAMGLRQFRVRHHGELARIELEADDLPRAVERRQAIVRSLTELGYRHVTLDLAGFRGGDSTPTVTTVGLTVEGGA